MDQTPVETKGKRALAWPEGEKEERIDFPPKEDEETPEERVMEKIPHKGNI